LVFILVQDEKKARLVSDAIANGYTVTDQRLRQRYTSSPHSHPVSSLIFHVPLGG